MAKNTSPKVIKLFQAFVDAKSTHGIAKTCKLPDFKRKFEEYRAGGFDTPVFLDTGGEALTCETTFAGMALAETLSSYGTPIHNGSTLHFMGAYEDQEAGTTDAYEVIMRGRHTWDTPDAKTGEIGETKMKTHISYIKVMINGKTKVEIDVTKPMFAVDGVDRLEQARSAAGL